jgi:hypothetical protein
MVEEVKETDDERIGRLVDERVAAQLKDAKMDDGERRLRAMIREESTSVLGEFFEKIADAEDKDEADGDGDGGAGSNDGGGGTKSLSEILAGFLK